MAMSATVTTGTERDGMVSRNGNMTRVHYREPSWSREGGSRGKTAGIIHATIPYLLYCLQRNGKMHHIHRFVLGTMALAGLVFFRDLLRDFVDLPSLLITLGGTLGVISFTYSRDTLKSVGTTVYMVLRAERVAPQEQLDTLVQLAQLNHL